MLALLSDIHANLEALEAVLAHARARGVTDFVCMGDIIGYGPNPRECVAIAQDAFRLALRGNHEQGVLFFPIGFNARARQALDWTRERLTAADKPSAENDGLWKYLSRLPEAVTEGDLLFVHGSPLDPVSQYVFPKDVADEELMSRIFARITRLAFCGHTHHPGIFLDGNKYIVPEELGGVCELGGQRALVNVGSVGQPRDGDNRACYATFEGSRVEFHRVPYDFGRTQAKIVEVPALPQSLGERLGQGL